MLITSTNGLHDSIWAKTSKKLSRSTGISQRNFESDHQTLWSSLPIQSKFTTSLRGNSISLDSVLIHAQEYSKLTEELLHQKTQKNDAEEQ